MNSLKESVTRVHNGHTFQYIECYTIGYEVDENTGMITDKVVKFYEYEHLNKNLKAMKEAYDKCISNMR